MAISLKKLKICIAAVAVVAHVHAWGQLQLVDGAKLRTGDVVEGILDFDGRKIPLLPGKWETVINTERPNNSGRKFVTLFFQQISDGTLAQLLQISFTQNSAPSRWIDEPCKPNAEVWWFDDRKHSFDDQFCTTITFSNNVVTSARGDVYLSWARGVHQRQLKFSPEYVAVKVTRYNTADFLTYTLNLNPQLRGIGPSSRPDRQFNDWHPENVNQFSDRLSYYKAVQAWAPTFVDTVDKVLRLKDVRPEDFGQPKF